MNDSKLMDMVAGFILRGCLGIGLVYFINTYLDSVGIVTQVGFNTITAITTASLGIPGVGLLYGITFFEML